MLLLFLQPLRLMPTCKAFRDVLSSCKPFIDHPLPGPVLDAGNPAKTETDAGPVNTEAGGWWRGRQEHRQLQCSMISVMIGGIKGATGTVLNKNAT